MSIRAMTWALDHRATGPIPPASRLVLVALADYASDETGRAWPSVATLAARLGDDERNVRRRLARLEELGVIERDHSPGAVALVANYRADRRPTVWLLALDGVQARLEDDGTLGAEPYREGRSDPPATPRGGRSDHPARDGRNDPGSPPRGGKNGSNGGVGPTPQTLIAPTPPNPPQCPRDPSARDDAKADSSTPVDSPGVHRIIASGPPLMTASVGLRDPECPVCGARIVKSHRCRGTLTPAATLPIGAPCEACGTTARPIVDTDLGVCARCLVARHRSTPATHRDEDLA